MAVTSKVLLLDEPTLALDPISTAEIDEPINELASGHSIVIVPPLRAWGVHVSNYTASMNLGELNELGANDTPFTKPGNNANYECMNRPGNLHKHSSRH